MNLLNRGNDLEVFFWPIFYFAKQQILENGTIPLWNNLFFGGTPLLPDPQSPLFYPPNIIFLFLPIGTAFLVSFFLHILAGGAGTYLAARKGFGFSKAASLFSAALYITTPQLAVRLEAGHFGLVAAFAWLPFVVLATLHVARKPTLGWSALLAVSLAGLFYTHVLIFTIASLAAAVFLLRKSPAFLSLAAVITFGLIAIAFLPQLEWKDQTTRFLLLNDRDVYPKWLSIKEFVQAMFWPWNTIRNIDTEKIITLGIFAAGFAFIGFLRLKRVFQVLLFTVALVLSLVALNNSSPLYQALIGQDWYVLLRVSTRIWFIPLLITVFLAGYGFDYLTKKRSWAKVIAAMAVLELLLLSWIRFSKPIPQQNLTPKEVYEFLSQDKSRFRVFCLSRCLSQKTAAEYNLELVEGYGTLQQMNYYTYFIQLSQVYWNRYTLALPPFEIYRFRELQPHTPTLAGFNVKYVVSEHELKDENFVLEEKFNNYFVYRNNIVRHRAYFPDGSEAPILKYSPNHIRVDTLSAGHPSLILAEVWSPGWKAYLNGRQEVAVQQTPEALRSVDLTENTKFINFKYQPESYKAGQIITLVTILFLSTYAIRKWKK